MSKLLIFDWDGTVVDSTAHIIDSINMAFRKIINKEFSPSDIKKIIGLSLPEAFGELTNNTFHHRYDDFVTCYKNIYIENRPAPFSGMSFGFERLINNNFTLAVATGKSRRGLDNDFKAFDLGKYFKDSKTADDCFSKPHPQMVNDLIANLMVEKDNSIMIGDSLIDQEMAVNAGIGFVGVSYGATNSKDFSKYMLYCASEPLDLFDWIIKNV